MRKKHLIKRAAAPVLAAACVFSQVGSAFAAAGPGIGLDSFTSGTWVHEANGWKHIDANGVQSTGWIKKASGWYYLDPATGIMKTGWFQDSDGKWYYFETDAEGVEGRLHAGWLQTTDGNWYFLNTLHDGSFGARLTGFQWIDGACYYLTEAEGADQGKMQKGVTLPNGQKLDDEGHLLDADGAVRHDQQGLPAKEQVTGSTANSSGSGGGSSSGGSSSGGGSGSGGGTGGGGSSEGNSNSDGNNGNQDPGNNGGDSSGDNTGDGGSGNNGNRNDSGSGNDGDGGNGGDSGSGDNEGGDSGSGGNGSEGEGGSGSEGEGGDTEQKTSLIDETKTVYQNVNDLGYWLPIVFDKGYNADNTVITVDGKKVNDNLTDVTTDGSVVKLALLSKPRTVTVTSETDSSSSETVEIGGAGSDAVYEGTEDYLPDKILTHGPVDTWDYYLTNYDEDGNVRVSPKRTTFNLGEEIERHPSFSPDAELDENGNAVVTILFNYNTEEEKAWFDGITGYELVQYDERNNTINDHLQGSRKADVSHGSGKVGEITIKAPQDNFRTNGRYYVRVNSSAGSSALAPIHLVNEKAPVLSLSETAQSGKNLHFAVKNMVYGIKTPIERVTLKDPTGDVRELRYIDDWYLFSQDLFVLYNDVEAENGYNNLQYNGNYTITLYSNGFKTVSKTFRVEDGIDVPSKEKAAVSFYDAISTASVGGGGSTGGSGSDSSGLAISANLIFDSDLLVNAYLLDKLDLANDASEAVLNWWYKIIKDAVFEIGGTYYDWTGYMDAVNESLVANESWLPYGDYSGEEYAYPPATAKEVLEDGLLGEIQDNGDYGKTDAPEYNIEQNKEGSDVVIRFKDGAEYVKKIYEIYKDGTTWTGIDKESYEISSDGADGILTIHKDQFTAGNEHTLSIRATGYRPCAFQFTYAIVQEENISLKVNYPEGQEAFTAEKTNFGDEDVFVADTSFTVENSEGGFLDKLGSVTLDGTNVVYPKGQEGSDAEYYIISQDKKQITLHNVKTGSHTLTLRALGYADPLETDFKVVEAEEEQVLAAPEAKSTEYVEAGMFDPAYYRVTFEESDEAETYLKLADKADQSRVTVNGTEYEKKSLNKETENGFRVSRDINGMNPGYRYIDLTVNAFTEDVNEVVIYVEGYEPLTLDVKKTGTTDPDVPGTEELAAPEPKRLKTPFMGIGQYYLIFEPYDKEEDGKKALEAYIEAVTSVTVGETEFTKGASYTKPGFAPAMQDLSVYDALGLTADFVELDEKTTIVVEAEGYEKLTFIVDGSGNIVKGDAELKAAPELTGETEIEVGAEVVLETGETDYLKNITEIQENGSAVAKSDWSVSTSSESLTLKSNLFTEAGGRSFVLLADGYEDQEITVQVNEKSEAEVLAPPSVSGVNYQNSSFNGGKYWEVELKAKNAKEIDAYLAADNFVLTVDGTEYERVDLGFFGSLGMQEYTIGTGSFGTVLKVAAEGMEAGTHEALITADGYEDLTFTIKVTKATAAADAQEEPEAEINGDISVPEKDQTDADDAVALEKEAADSETSADRQDNAGEDASAEENAAADKEEAETETNPAETDPADEKTDVEETVETGSADETADPEKTAEADEAEDAADGSVM